MLSVFRLEPSLSSRLFALSHFKLSAMRLESSLLSAMRLESFQTFGYAPGVISNSRLCALSHCYASGFSFRFSSLLSAIRLESFLGPRL